MHALKAIVLAALLTATAAQGTTSMPDSPHYRDGVPTLPAVNTDAQVGKYQDVTFSS